MSARRMKTLLLPALGLVVLMAGFVVGSNWSRSRDLGSETASRERRILHYVDPMNPAHTSQEPGLAPCGMKMEPVYADEVEAGKPADGGPVLPGTVRVSTEKQQLMGVKMGGVEKRALVVQRRLLGRVAADETRVYQINATVDGWITEAMPVATGDRVTNGQTLATFYSPEFLSAGQALLFALYSQDRVRTTGNETAAQQSQITQFNLNLQQYRDSLRNLGMSDAQIQEMMQSREFAQRVRILSPAEGFLTARTASDGLRFEKGTELYRVTDLNRVWILAEVFERDAHLLQTGATVRVSLPQQNRSFPARVSEALPQFDPVTRTLKVRLEADNPDFALKPDLFVDVEVSAPLPESLVVPAEAVLDAGLRRTVFVDRGNGFFEPRGVVTGEQAGDQVQVLQGLMAGERIVVSGHFLLDSESRMKLAADGIHGAFRLDPLCGMAVDEMKARAAGLTFDYEGHTYFFCNEGCCQAFASNPEKSLRLLVAASAAPSPAAAEPNLPVVNRDPVCGMTVSEPKARVAGRVLDHAGRTYLFCSDGCRAKFAASPATFLTPKSDSASGSDLTPHRDQPHH